jgi:hypothetical protein
MAEASKPVLRSGAESGDALTGWLVASTVVIAALQRAQPPVSTVSYVVISPNASPHWIAAYGSHGVPLR